MSRELSTPSAEVCFLAEIQESSNVTYRVYDYGRKDKAGNLRQLHIEKALSVMNFNAAPFVRQRQRIVQYTSGMAKKNW